MIMSRLRVNRAIQKPHWDVNPTGLAPNNHQRVRVGSIVSYRLIGRRKI